MTNHQYVAQSTHIKTIPDSPPSVVAKHMKLVRGIWHYRFAVAGVRIQRTTRERDYGRAEKVAQRAYEDAITRANGGKLVPTLATLVDEWLDVHSPVVSVSHASGVAVFARCHLYDLGALPVTELSTERVERARNRHLETRSQATANHWLRTLKLVVNWAVKREILPKLPWNVAMIKVQRRPRVTLSIGMAKEWLAALDKAAHMAPSIKTAVRLMFGLGLRASEAAGARWEWIDWERKTYTPGVTKGKESVAIPIPAWVFDYLTPISSTTGLIAPRRYKKEKPMPPGYAIRAIGMANSACGITGITPHRLRGSFATLLSEEGTPVQTIQRIMRHKDVSTTMGYLEVNIDTAAQAQNRLGERMGFSSGGGGALAAQH